MIKLILSLAAIHGALGIPEAPILQYGVPTKNGLEGTPVLFDTAYQTSVAALPGTRNLEAKSQLPALPSPPQISQSNAQQEEVLEVAVAPENSELPQHEYVSGYFTRPIVYNRAKDVSQLSENQGYDYQKPESQGYDYPKPESQGYDYPKPESQGYDYPKPESQGYDYPKPESQGYDYPKPESQGYDYPRPDNQGGESQQSESVGYDYPKPDNQGGESQQPESIGYDYPKPDNQGGESQQPESIGYDYPKPDNQGSESQQPESPGYEYQKPSTQSPYYHYPPVPAPGAGSPFPPEAGSNIQETVVGPDFPKPSLTRPSESGQQILPTGAGESQSPVVIPPGSKIKIEDGRGQYSHGFSGPDGTQVQESGHLITTNGGWEYVIAKEGSYSYTSPEGIPIRVGYVADDNGFRITSRSFGR